ncbi:MAG: cytochrome P450 [Gammaproteobacteria bacterium]|nr:cytochrome P450 [Gammaproteobacteria bacterium]MCZ6827182.1 cytochrome P450 [Gammaproteobacteria bacterium]
MPELLQPYGQAFAANPYPTYARLREQNPIFHSEEFGLTFFTRYRDIVNLLSDKRLGRTMSHVMGPEEKTERHRQEDWQATPAYSRFVRVNLLESEGADHARLRRLLAKAVDARRIGGLSQRIEMLVDELLEGVVDCKEIDFLAEIAVPLPVYVISEMLGWPAEERHRLRPWSADIVRLYEKDHSEEDVVRAEAATEEFAGMLGELAELRRSDPRDDLISAFALLESDGEILNKDELIASCMMLLNAGHEALVNSAGNGLLALLRHPEQGRRLQRDRSMMKTATEEMLRYDSPLQFFHRFVLEDMNYGDFEFRQGDKVGLLYGSGNRDPAAFERPDSFDIGRDPNRHLAFGLGPHFCLGAPLARLELGILFNKLLRRFPGVQLVDEHPEYRTGLVFRGLKQLSVRW